MKTINKIMVVGSGVAVVAAAVLGVNAFAPRAPTTPTPRTIELVAPSPAPTHTPVPTPVPTPYAGPVDLTVEVTATMPWSETLEPDNFIDVYQLVDEDHGFYASGGTHFITAHSYAKGYGAPGNAWEELTVGQVVAYDRNFYRANMISTPSQNDIASEPIWDNDPNMLVMITCLSRGPGQPATNNFIIRLELIDN